MRNEGNKLMPEEFKERILVKISIDLGLNAVDGTWVVPV